jgi:hypothetical protein
MCFVITTSQSLYVSAAQCDSILEYAAANIQQRASKSVAQAEMANNLCTDNYEKMESSQRTSIEASYSVFSAKFGSDSQSLKEWRNKHCESGQSKDFKASESTEYSRTVYDNSVAAWIKCVELQNSGVLVQPEIHPNGQFLTFSVKYVGSGSVKLIGVSILPPDSFVCKDSKKRLVDLSTEVQLSTRAWALACTRVVEKVTDANGGKYESAPAAMLTIQTEDKSFPWPFAELRSPDIATRKATELFQTIESLKSGLSTSISRISLECKSVHNSGQDVSCPEGYLVTGCSAGRNYGSITLDDTKAIFEKEYPYSRCWCRIDQNVILRQARIALQACFNHLHRRLTE